MNAQKTFSFWRKKKEERNGEEAPQDFQIGDTLQSVTKFIFSRVLYLEERGVWDGRERKQEEIFTAVFFQRTLLSLICQPDI